MVSHNNNIWLDHYILYPTYIYCATITSRDKNIFNVEVFLKFIADKHRDTGFIYIRLRDVIRRAIKYKISYCKENDAPRQLSQKLYQIF